MTCEHGIPDEHPCIVCSAGERKFFTDIEGLEDLVNQLIIQIRDNWEHDFNQDDVFLDCKFEDGKAKAIGKEAVSIIKDFFNVAMADILGAGE